MNENSINMLEKELIKMGEDETFIGQLRNVYVENFGKEVGLSEYFSHLKEITKKYYGGVQ